MGSCWSVLGWVGLPCHVTWPTSIGVPVGVGVFTGVNVGVLVPVKAGVAVRVFVGVLVDVGQPLAVAVNVMVELMGPDVLHKHCVNLPAPSCVPIVAVPPVFIVPMTTVKLAVLSFNLISK